MDMCPAPSSGSPAKLAELLPTRWHATAHHIALPLDEFRSDVRVQNAERCEMQLWIGLDEGFPTLPCFVV